MLSVQCVGRNFKKNWEVRQVGLSSVSLCVNVCGYAIVCVGDVMEATTLYSLVEF